MKITYLKSHNGKSQGDTDNVSDELGKYLVRCGVASTKADVTNNDVNVAVIGDKKHVGRPKKEKETIHTETIEKAIDKVDKTKLDTK